MKKGPILRLGPMFSRQNGIGSNKGKRREEVELFVLPLAPTAYHSLKAVGGTPGLAGEGDLRNKCRAEQQAGGGACWYWVCY